MWLSRRRENKSIIKLFERRELVSLRFDRFNVWDWYYTLNIIYSDYVAVIGNTPSTYISLAKAWINDKDAEEGKAYRYYMAIPKKGKIKP